MNLFENQELNYERLVSEYVNHDFLVIGVDFDDTIRDFDTGLVINPVVELLKEARKHNCILCLYTCREEKRLVEATKFCEKIGLEMDYINSSPIILHTRKPLFNILLDDRAGLVESYNLLKKFIDDVKDGKIKRVV